MILFNMTILLKVSFQNKGNQIKLKDVIAYAYLFSVWKIAVSIMWQISQSSVNLRQTMIYFLSKFVPELNHETAVK